MTRLEQYKKKIKRLDKELNIWKANAQIWKFYYKRSQDEVHRLHLIIRKLEKKQ